MRVRVCMEGLLLLLVMRVDSLKMHTLGLNQAEQITERQGRLAGRGARGCGRDC